MLRLAKDIPQRRKLDETAGNFDYGQFEVFIPASKLDLPMGCKTYYIARMPQTTDISQQQLIKQKQALYFSLVDVYKGKKSAQKVVFEMPY